MTNIKKMYTDLYALLIVEVEENPRVTVKSLMPKITELMSAKTTRTSSDPTSYRDPETNEVIAIRCAYHNLWFDPRAVEFSNKTSASTGLSNMCKDGASKLAKQTREAKKLESELLDAVMAGEVEVADLPAKKEEIEAIRIKIVPMDAEIGTGYPTLEDLLATYS